MVLIGVWHDLPLPRCDGRGAASSGCNVARAQQPASSASAVSLQPAGGVKPVGGVSLAGCPGGRRAHDPGQFVGVFQVAPHGETARQAGDTDAERRQNAGDVHAVASPSRLGFVPTITSEIGSSPKRRSSSAIRS